VLRVWLSAICSSHVFVARWVASMRFPAQVVIVSRDASRILSRLQVVTRLQGRHNGVTFMTSCGDADFHSSNQVDARAIVDGVQGVEFGISPASSCRLSRAS
jgi:hypothetical protein